jgi:lysyl-tRNA synthetase class 2
MTFRPTASWPILRLRAELLARARAFFRSRSFLEVETSILSADVVVDRHLDPFSTTLCVDPRQPDAGRKLWLQTSPEFHMKRLLAAGAGPIFQVARVFRNAERGAWHNPEFTMIEWYRPGDDMAAGIQLLSDLCESLLERGPATQISYAEVFRAHAGIEPHAVTVDELATRARSLGISPPESLSLDDRDAWLDLLLVERVQPHLGVGSPAIVYDYPAGQAALACVRNEDPPVAERFELYVEGIELANGYHELLDAETLRQRNIRNNVLRVADGKPALPEESRLLAAMEAGLPPCTGVALGFDRLVMLAAGVTSIEQVLAFPIERA